MNFEHFGIFSGKVVALVKPDRLYQAHSAVGSITIYSGIIRYIFGYDQSQHPPDYPRIAGLVI
jgi:hypothetical protein